MHGVGWISMPTDLAAGVIAETCKEGNWVTEKQRNDLISQSAIITRSGDEVGAITTVSTFSGYFLANDNYLHNERADSASKIDENIIFCPVERLNDLVHLRKVCLAISFGSKWLILI